MIQMKERNILLNKLNNIHGFSLSETLTTMIIMSFVGIMVTTGIMSSTRVYKQITEYTNAQLMLSNTITVLHDELIYALPGSLPSPAEGPKKEITFEHIKNGKETIEYKVYSDGVESGSTENKGIYISYEGGNDSFYPLVSYQNSTSLYNDWNVSNKGDGVISISVSVHKANGTKLIEVNDYEIKLLNGLKYEDK